MDMIFVQKRPKDSNLYKHAKDELELAGLLKDEGLYGDMLGEALLDLVAVFASQGHSGMSGAIVIDLLPRLLNFEPLTELTYESDQWVKRNYGPDVCSWQHKRNGSIFSDDYGQTWYSVNDPERIKHTILVPAPADEEAGDGRNCEANKEA